VLQTYGQITPYWMPGTQTLDIDSADVAFAQGRSSFLVGGTFTLAFLAQNGFDLNNLVTFPIPAPSGGAVSDLSLAPFALTGLSVSANTAHKDAALQWLRHLADPGVATQFARDALDVPPTDLGNDAGTVLGPVLGTMVASLGEGEKAYNPGYTAYRPGAYDSGRVGEVLMNYTPLQQQDAAGAGHDLADLIGSYWSEQR
jgi:multiple sugar transport system substrate-binding protein